MSGSKMVNGLGLIINLKKCYKLVNINVNRKFYLCDRGTF